MWLFIAGMFVGVCLGVLLMGLLITSSNADKKNPYIKEGKEVSNDAYENKSNSLRE